MPGETQDVAAINLFKNGFVMVGKNRFGKVAHHRAALRKAKLLQENSNSRGMFATFKHASSKKLKFPPIRLFCNFYMSRMAEARRTLAYMSERAGGWGRVGGIDASL